MFSCIIPRRARTLAVFFFLTGAFACVVFAGGCGHGDRPTLGMVSGMVTLNGRPLSGARLIFEPLEGGRASVGKTDEDGKYELIYIRKDKGAKVGKHKVQIVSDTDGSENIPARYNTQTTLEADVKSGVNDCNFTLTSR